VALDLAVVGVGSTFRAWDLHACGVSNRAEYMLALYEGSLAELGDHNPYNGKSLLLAKLWHRGYMRMLRVRIQTGPAMQAYRGARAADNDD
jgi:hypothetical protein